MRSFQKKPLATELVVRVYSFPIAICLGYGHLNTQSSGSVTAQNRGHWIKRHRAKTFANNTSRPYSVNLFGKS